METKMELVTIETLALTPKTVDRFWSKVDKSGSCWVWKAETDRWGYGRFWMGKKRKLAHRVAMAIITGRIDPTMFVLHSCDNPPCVKPDHLRYGTHKENMREMAERTTPNMVHGPRDHSHNVKLTDAQVTEIWWRIKAGESQSALGREFNVVVSTISDIKFQKTWKFLTDTLEAGK